MKRKKITAMFLIAALLVAPLVLPSNASAGCYYGAIEVDCKARP